MNSFADKVSFFSGHSGIGINEALIVYSRLTATPAPFCLTLINLDSLEETMLQEQADGHLLSLLSSREKELFSGFAYPKRRREWLGGRLAAKYAVFQLLQREGTPETLSALSIMPNSNGSPRISNSFPTRDELPALSISHSGRFAVAMAAAAESCGIDIQKVSAQTVRVADRFCEPDELQILREHAPLLNEKEQMTLLWSAKEALKKALLHDQPVIFQGVALQSVALGRHFTLRLHFPGDLGQPAVITALMFEECVLAYTLVHARHA